MSRSPSGIAYTQLHIGSEKVLIALHGLGGERNQALDLLDTQSLSEFTIVALDLRCHGESTLEASATDFSFEALAADVHTLLSELGLERRPVSLAGVSMGAAVALHIAADPRLDVRAAAYVRPAFTSVPDPEHLAALVLAGTLLESHGTVRGRIVYQRSIAYDAVRRVSAAGAASLLAQFGEPHARARAQRLIRVPHNVAFAQDGAMPAPHVSTLVVAAPRDPNHPVAVAEEWARRLTAGAFAVVTPRDIDEPAYRAQIRAAVTAHILAGKRR
jgi:pimeloyl-ACP methyl ester carboxylesterase